MNATLYRPNREPEPILGRNFALPDSEGYAEVTAEVAEVLGCCREAVDILATGPGYVAYSVFDSEGEINDTASRTLNVLTKSTITLKQEENDLRGNVLIVHNT